MRSAQLLATDPDNSGSFVSGECTLIYLAGDGRFDPPPKVNVNSVRIPPTHYYTF